MPRAVKEWVGKTPDARVPPRVRLRVLEAYDRKCYLTGNPIPPGASWELEHKVALILGGEHREANMAPALADPHKKKTATEMKVKSKIADVAKRAYGIDKPKQKIAARPKAPRPAPKFDLTSRRALFQPAEPATDILKEARRP